MPEYGRRELPPSLRQVLQRGLDSGMSVTVYTEGGHTFTGYPKVLNASAVQLSHGDSGGPQSTVALDSIVGARWL